MRKRTFLSLVASLFMIASYAQVFDYDGFKFKVISNDGVALITNTDKYYTPSGYKPVEYVGDIVIPSTVSYDGVDFNVISIGEYIDENSALDNNINILQPDNAGPFAKMTGITSVTIPEGVQYIGVGAFYGCQKLTTVNIPKGVKSIGASAFNFCFNLESLSIPEGLINIGRYAFLACENIQMDTITIPQSVKTIGDHAFEYTDIKTAIIPDGASVGDDIIGSGQNIYELYNQSEGLHYYGVMNGTPSLVIPDGITRIGNRSFCNNRTLTSVTLPASIQEIGANAFSGCTNLTTINIPENIKNIEDGAFDDTPWFDDWYSSQPDGLICIGKIVYNYKGDMPDNTSITIPDGITTIGSNAFRYCSNLTSISIPESVTIIGSYAFSECCSLASITIPEGVTCIEEGVFSGCNSLSSASFPASITKVSSNALDETPWLDNQQGSLICIGKVAYKYTGNNTSVDIPDGITTIADGLFSGNESLTSLSIPASVTNIGEYAFGGCINLSSVVIPESVTSIRCGTFMNCTNLQSVSIPESVIRIEDYAFSNCSKIQSITIPEHVEYIGKSAFEWCSPGYLNFPDGVLYIGKNAFRDCRPSSLNLNTIINITSIIERENIRTVSFGVKVRGIANRAFSGCRNLIEVNIPEGIKYIGEGAFSDCNNLTSINISGAINIEAGAFMNCTKLSSIDLPDCLNKIDECAFYQCSIKTIAIPDGVTYIGRGSFALCRQLTKVTIPGSVVIVGEDTHMPKTVNYNYGAFESCGLRSVIIQDGVTTIGDRAFYGCGGLDTISIPESVVSIGELAFEGTPWYENNKDGVPIIEITANSSDIIDMAGRSATQTTDIPYIDVIIIDGKKYLMK